MLNAEIIDITFDIKQIKVFFIPLHAKLTNL